MFMDHRKIYFELLLILVIQFIFFINPIYLFIIKELQLQSKKKIVHSEQNLKM